MPGRGPRIAAAAMAAAIAALFGSAPAQAQANEPGALVNRLERMERELLTLQRQVYQGRPPPPAAAAGDAVAGSSGDAPFRAEMEVRLTQIEDAQRNATGRLEELAHAVQQFGQRLEKLVADVDFRLTALERAQKGLPALVPVPPADATPGQPGGAPPPGAPPGVLGTIPKGAAESGAPGQAPTAAAPVPPAGERPPMRQEPALPAGPPEKQYEYATSLILQKQDYERAEAALRAFIEAHPNHELAASAYYWLGRTYFVRKNFQQAAVTFAEGFQKYPKSNKAPDNLFDLGLSLGKLGKNKEACTAFDRLTKTFPQSSPTLKGRVARERQSLACA